MESQTDAEDAMANWNQVEQALALIKEAAKEGSGRDVSQAALQLRGLLSAVRNSEEIPLAAPNEDDRRAQHLAERVAEEAQIATARTMELRPPDSLVSDYIGSHDNVVNDVGIPTSDQRFGGGAAAAVAAASAAMLAAAAAREESVRRLRGMPMQVSRTPGEAMPAEEARENLGTLRTPPGSAVAAVEPSTSSHSAGPLAPPTAALGAGNHWVMDGREDFHSTAVTPYPSMTSWRDTEGDPQQSSALVREAARRIMREHDVHANDTFDDEALVATILGLPDGLADQVQSPQVGSYCPEIEPEHEPCGYRGTGCNSNESSPQRSPHLLPEGSRVCSSSGPATNGNYSAAQRMDFQTSLTRAETARQRAEEAIRSTVSAVLRPTGVSAQCVGVVQGGAAPCRTPPLPVEGLVPTRAARSSAPCSGSSHIATKLHQQAEELSERQRSPVRPAHQGLHPVNGAAFLGQRAGLLTAASVPPLGSSPPMQGTLPRQAAQHPGRGLSPVRPRTPSPHGGVVVRTASPKTGSMLFLPAGNTSAGPRASSPGALADARRDAAAQLGRTRSPVHRGRGSVVVATTHGHAGPTPLPMCQRVCSPQRPPAGGIDSAGRGCSPQRVAAAGGLGHPQLIAGNAVFSSVPIPNGIPSFASAAAAALAHNTAAGRAQSPCTGSLVCPSGGLRQSTRLRSPRAEQRSPPPANRERLRPRPGSPGSSMCRLSTQLAAPNAIPSSPPHSPPLSPAGGGTPVRLRPNAGTGTPLAPGRQLLASTNRLPQDWAAGQPVHLTHQVQPQQQQQAGQALQTHIGLGAPVQRATSSLLSTSGCAGYVDAQRCQSPARDTTCYVPSKEVQTRLLYCRNASFEPAALMQPPTWPAVGCNVIPGDSRMRITMPMNRGKMAQRTFDQDYDNLGGSRASLVGLGQVTSGGQPAVTNPTSNVNEPSEFDQLPPLISL